MHTCYIKKVDQIYSEYKNYIIENSVDDLFEQSFYLITLLGIKYRYIVLLDDAKYIDVPRKFIERTIAFNLG